jgi:hypothetical protein
LPGVFGAGTRSRAVGWSRFAGRAPCWLSRPTRRWPCWPCWGGGRTCTRSSTRRPRRRVQTPPPQPTKPPTSESSEWPDPLLYGPLDPPIAPQFHTRPRFVSVPLGRVDHAWRSHHETPPKTRPSFERAPTSQTHLAGLRATDPPRRPRSTRQAHRGVARRASSRPRPRRPRLPSTSRAAWPRAVLQAEPAVPHDRCGRGNSRAVRSVSS